jgi:hypothetical protein
VRERKGSNIKSNNALINPQSRLVFSERVIGALNGSLNEAFPLLDPFASMRAPQDEDNDTALDRSSLVTCGWDPGKDDAEASLSDCETVLACAAYDGSTFVDDFAVAGGISGNGLPTTAAMTTTPARDFDEEGTAHDDDAVSDDDDDPD